MGREVPEIKMPLVPRWVQEIDPKCYTVLESLLTGEKIWGGNFWFPYFLGLVKPIFLRKKGKMAIFFRKTAIFDPKKYLEPKISPPDLFSC